MNELKVFQHEEFGKVRTILLDNEVWFVGKDVAEALGYKAERNAIAKHVSEDDKLTHRISASGQNREMTIINESGMYALIFGSKLPQAMEFKRWVTSVVLPSIRKYGGYIAEQEKLSDEELLSRAYLLALKQIEERDNELEELIPKGQYFDELVDIGNCTCFRDTAKELGIPQNRFINLLLDLGYLFRNDSGQLRYYASASKYFHLKEYVSRKSGHAGVYTVVRPEGKEFFMELFKDLREK